MVEEEEVLKDDPEGERKEVVAPPPTTDTFDRGWISPPPPSQINHANSAGQTIVVAVFSSCFRKLFHDSEGNFLLPNRLPFSFQEL